MATQSATDTSAAARVRKYVEQRTGMRPLDPDEVHAVHVGDEREARLTLSDLRALLAMADAYARAKAENDERFQLEAGEQRQRADLAREALEKYGQHASMRPAERRELDSGRQA